jgi:hypothetical protein
VGASKTDPRRGGTSNKLGFQPQSFALSNNVFFRFLPLNRLSIAKLPLAKLIVSGDVKLRNSFGLSADELARLLEHWRERAAAD